MSASMNRATILGYLGSDPTIRDLNEGGRVASLSVATNESWTDKDSGAKKERTEWHRVSVFSEPLVALIEKSLHKGSRVLLEGSLQTRQYEKDGVNHYSTEIVLRPYNGSLTLLDAPKSEPTKPKPDTRSGNRRTSNQPRPAA
jgi:single-strand DNA-binding protein